MDIRPATFDDYVGQNQARRILWTFVADAKRNGNPAPDFLLYGGSGLGKTTLAQIVANEMKGKIVLTTGMILKTPKDVINVLITLNPFDVLFIDEIHEMKAPEALYTAMEDGRIEVPVTSGKVAMTISYKLPRITIIGATTDPSYLPAALRNRFKMIGLSPYSSDEMTKIVKRSLSVFGLVADDDSVQEIVIRSRSTPRQANQFIDYIRAKSLGNPVDKATTLKAFKELGIDTLGLTELDRRYLTTLIDRYDGGAVGLETLSATLGEEPNSLHKMIEPYLLAQGLIELTRKGRVALPSAYLHLGLKPKEEKLI